jgi:alanine racemase
MPGPEGTSRPAWAEVDLGAVAHNVGILRRVTAPASLWAVVKADAYGHGALDVAAAALDAGAAGLAVALVEEGIALRDAGVRAPILLLSEPPAAAYGDAVGAGLTPTVYSAGGIGRAADAARALGRRVGVHLKIDTGMHRVGADPGDVATLGEQLRARRDLDLEGAWTHLAVADGVSDDDRSFTELQLRRFERALGVLAATGLSPRLRHAANSAGAIVYPSARYDLVRCGIALYGSLPSPAVAAALAAATGGATVRPVLSLHARVSTVRVLDAGERPSYGRRRPLPVRSVVATVPLGYADGVPRGLFEAGASVLIGGRRRLLAGTVTMDQLIVDCGPEALVEPGDEVVLLGRQGDEEITADEWATLLGTISYEVLCGIGPRVPRRVLDAPQGAPSAGAESPTPRSERSA